MAKKRVRVDDFINLLKNEQVTDTLVEKLSVKLVLVIEGVFNHIVDYKETQVTGRTIVEVQARKFYLRRKNCYICLY